MAEWAQCPPYSLQRLDLEASRGFAAAVDVPHGGVGRLDMTAEPIGVEQRAREAIRRELAPDRLQPRRFGGELERQRLVFLEIARDELRQPCRVELAGRDPARKRGSRTGQER